MTSKDGTGDDTDSTADGSLVEVWDGTLEEYKELYSDRILVGFLDGTREGSIVGKVDG